MIVCSYPCRLPPRQCSSMPVKGLRHPTMQTRPHNEQSQVTQGQIIATQWKSSLWNELFWDIHPRCDMVHQQAYDHLWNHFLLGPLTSGLCYGKSTSSNWDRYLHGIVTRDSNQAWEVQGSRFEAREEYLRPLETGWVQAEFIPCGQTHIHRTHTVTNRWLFFFCADIIFMVYVDNGIFLGSNDCNFKKLSRRSRT